MEMGQHSRTARKAINTDGVTQKGMRPDRKWRLKG